MKRKILSIAAVVLSIVISGCSSNYTSLAGRGLVSVEEQDSDKVKILWTDVYQQDGQKWAYGVLKQRNFGSGVIQTHVDIQVLNTDGSVEYETITEDLFVPRNRIGNGTGWKKFRVLLPENLPEGSKVSMMVHSGSHKNQI